MLATDATLLYPFYSPTTSLKKNVNGAEYNRSIAKHLCIVKISFQASSIKFSKY